jgi:hypothetical protein
LICPSITLDWFFELKYGWRVLTEHAYGHFLESGVWGK